MNKIEVNIIVVDSTLREISRIIDDLNKIRDNLRKSNSSLSAYWKGQSYDAFIAKSNKMHKDVDIYIDALKSFKDQLRSIEDEFMETDKSLARKSNSLMY